MKVGADTTALAGTMAASTVTFADAMASLLLLFNAESLTTNEYLDPPQHVGMEAVVRRVLSDPGGWRAVLGESDGD